MVQTSLFPETQDAIIARIDGEILHLLTGQPGGPLNLTLDDCEKHLLTCIRYRRGLEKAINIRDLELQTELKPRVIKETIRNLRVNFSLPIGSSKRGSAGGYYIIITDEDEAAWVNDVFNQAKAEFAVVRAVVRRRKNLERLGQLVMEVCNG